MSNQDRVLGRRGARDLTPEEELLVTGASGPLRTLTVCSVPNLTATLDGDPGECS
ncbi:MAG TPA: hypothetical protein VG488_07615 [Candidatus Angelobacter sp.]|jgi:hypothetical protein|nr:hypothetical protein [Candidatus Angelobacter sp.]